MCVINFLFFSVENAWRNNCTVKIYPSNAILYQACHTTLTIITAATTKSTDK